MDKKPEILCSLYFTFQANIDINDVVNYLKKTNIDNIIYRQEPQTNDHELRILHMYYKKFWHLDDALTLLFEALDEHKINLLSQCLNNYSGTAFLDIAFFQYGTYPSLEFTGKNMDIIRMLKADISIDPY